MSAATRIASSGDSRSEAEFINMLINYYYFTLHYSPQFEEKGTCKRPNSNFWPTFCRFCFCRFRYSTLHQLTAGRSGRSGCKFVHLGQHCAHRVLALCKLLVLPCFSFITDPFGLRELHKAWSFWGLCNMTITSPSKIKGCLFIQSIWYYYTLHVHQRDIREAIERRRLKVSDHSTPSCISVSQISLTRPIWASRMAQSLAILTLCN